MAVESVANVQISKMRGCSWVGGGRYSDWMRVTVPSDLSVLLHSESKVWAIGSREKVSASLKPAEEERQGLWECVRSYLYCISDWHCV